jgi:cell pole-organizing protein PopZ
MPTSPPQAAGNKQPETNAVKAPASEAAPEAKPAAAVETSGLPPAALSAVRAATKAAGAQERQKGLLVPKPATPAQPDTTEASSEAPPRVPVATEPPAARMQVPTPVAPAQPAMPQPPQAQSSRGLKPVDTAPLAADDQLSRSLDDTLAELLRPMVRQWLDENMSRALTKAVEVEIAERARQELSRRKIS